MISKPMHPQRSQDSRPSLLRSLAAWHQLNSQQSEFLLLPGVIAVEVLKRPPEHQIGFDLTGMRTSDLREARNNAFSHRPHLPGQAAQRCNDWGSRIAWVKSASMRVHTQELHFKQTLLLVTDPFDPSGTARVHGEWLVLLCCDATDVHSRY